MAAFMNACCISLYIYVCVHCVQSICVSNLYSTKDINDVALNKKISLGLFFAGFFFFFFFFFFWGGGGGDVYREGA